MKRLLLMTVIALMTICLCACGSDEESETISFETKGGYTGEVLTECPLDVATAASSAISQLVPGSDTSKMATQNFMATKYDNGMYEVSFQGVVIDGNEFGGEAYLELDGDKSSTHYLQVANEEYLNDGIDLSEYNEK